MRRAPEAAGSRYAGAGFRLLVARGHESRIEALGLDEPGGFDARLASARSVPGGRGPHRLLPLDDQTIRVRPSRHGGLLARWQADRFLSPVRTFREFRIATHLRARGMPLATPIFAASRRRGLFWRSALATLEVGGALDGAAWLRTHPEPAEIHAACVAFAQALRRFHDAGALHGDLHLRNVLVEVARAPSSRAEIRCVLIDLDRTRLVTRASARARLRELMRLARSVEKRGHRDLVSKRLQARTLAAYCGGDRGLRRAMLRWRAWETLRLTRHRLGWRIRGGGATRAAATP